MSWPGNETVEMETKMFQWRLSGHLKLCRLRQCYARSWRGAGVNNSGISSIHAVAVLLYVEYPAVTNPFVPQPMPDGRMAPALLTDDGISLTVVRSLKYGKADVNLKQSEVVLAKGLNQAYRKVLGHRGQRLQVRDSIKPIAGYGQDLKKLVTPEKSIDKIPIEGAKEQQKTESSEAPKNKNLDLLIYLIAGFIVLVLIYFIFQKEENDPSVVYDIDSKCFCDASYGCVANHR